MKITMIKPSKGWVALNLKDLWKYRELVYFLIWRDIKVRYKQAALGVAWAILQPILTMVIFSVIFGKFGKLPTDNTIPYPLFTFAALLPWQLFANALQRAGTSLVGSANLITKIYFPTADHPHFGGGWRFGGFWSLITGTDRTDDLLRSVSRPGMHLWIIPFPDPDFDHCAGGGFVAFSNECALPRCPADDPVS